VANQKPAPGQKPAQQQPQQVLLDANDARQAISLQQGRLDTLATIERLLGLLKQTSLTDSTRVVGIAGDIKEMLFKLDAQAIQQSSLLAQFQEKYDCKNCQWGEGFQSLIRPAAPQAP
jgi:hypothetical protein